MDGASESGAALEDSAPTQPSLVDVDLGVEGNIGGVPTTPPDAEPGDVAPEVTRAPASPLGRKPDDARRGP